MYRNNGSSSKRYVVSNSLPPIAKRTRIVSCDDSLDLAVVQVARVLPSVIPSHIDIPPEIVPKELIVVERAVAAVRVKVAIRQVKAVVGFESA